VVIGERSWAPAEIRKIVVQSQTGRIVHETLSGSGVAQGVDPEFKPKYHKTNKQTNKKQMEKE
jgi:hypothetical protein